MGKGRIFSISIILILLAAQFYPAVASNDLDQKSDQTPSYLSMEIVSSLTMMAQLNTQNQPVWILM